MLIITAPAKTLDTTSSHQTVHPTQPLFLPEATQIREILKSKSITQLKKLMHISDKIAEENFERFQKWQPIHTEKNSRPAIFTYAGDIYSQMFPKDWSNEQMSYAHRSVRIISGLYGYVRPLDLIEPYRLEMKAKLRVKKSKNLYEFWKKTLTNALNQEIETDKHDYLLNLASDESSDAIDLEKLHCKVVRVDFRERVGKATKNVPIYSKLARGMMIEWCVKHMITRPKDITGFNTKGYKYVSQSTSSIEFNRG